MRNIFRTGISHTFLINFLQKTAISHTLSGYDTDKIFERGESVSRMFKNVADGIGNFTPKPKFNKGSSPGGEPTPPPSGKSWLSWLTGKALTLCMTPD